MEVHPVSVLTLCFTGITRSVGYHALKVVDIYSTATKTWRTPPELPFKLMGVFSVQHLDTFFLGSGSNDVGGNAIYRNVWDIRHDQVQVVGSIQVAGKFRAGFLVPLYYLQCNWFVCSCSSTMSFASVFEQGPVSSGILSHNSTETGPKTESGLLLPRTWGWNTDTL